MEIVSLRSVPAGVLRRCHTELLEPAFPPAELMTYDELHEGLSGGDTDGLLVLEGQEPVAGIVTEEYVHGRVLLIAYLVVSQPLRGRGIGAELLRRSVGSQNKLALAEIEDPRFHTASPSGGDPAARVRFYDGHGSQLLPLDYTQPALREGSPRVGNLLLVTIPSAWPLTDFVDGGLVVEFLDEYYSVCEGDNVVASDLEYLALRRAALGEGGRLPLASLANLETARPSP